VLKAVEVTSDLPGASIKSLLVKKTAEETLQRFLTNQLKKQKRFSRSIKKFHLHQH